jgi:hypothetical protein
MCINCVIKDIVTGVAGMGIALCTYKLFSRTIEHRDTEHRDTETRVVKQQYVMIEGKLKDPSVIKRNISRTSCVTCNSPDLDYSIAVYTNDNHGDFRGRIFHNCGESIYIIFACEKCRNEIFAMADSIKRSGINKRIIATFYDAEGNDTGVVVNYNKLKPDTNRLCPYPDVTKCAYSPVCQHCNMNCSVYSIIISTDKCETGKYEQSFVCVDCHQKLLNAPGNIFPLDSDGFRLYDDIDVFTFTHTLPIGSKIRESVVGIDTSIISSKRQRMYPDIHGAH